MRFFNIPSLNLSFLISMGLTKPNRMTTNCQNSLRIKFYEKLISSSVRCEPERLLLNLKFGIDKKNHNFCPIIMKLGQSD